MRGLAFAIAACAGLLGSCAAGERAPGAAGATVPGPEDPAVPAAPAPTAPTGEPGEETFLAPNARDSDGTPAFVHVEPEDMPLLVAIGLPPTAPEGGSREQGREAAIEQMRGWERAIQPALPWFRLEFVEQDPSAAVQVVWKRRLTGDWGGWGGTSYAIVDGKLRVGGKMELSITPSPFVRLKLEDLRLLVAHEFGHVLGLGHCLECDSAMNYAFDTTDRVLITELDVRTFLALVKQPNGRRIDGQPLLALRRAQADAAR